MSTKDHAKAKDVFEDYYFGIVNPATPVIAKYGILGDPKPDESVLYYEISRNEAGTLYGLTVLRKDPDGAVQEQRSMRAVKRTLDGIRQEIADIVLRFNPL